MSVSGAVVHYEVEQVLNSGGESITLSLESNVHLFLILFVLVLLVLKSQLLVEFLEVFAASDQQVYCPEDLPVLVVFHVQLPLLLIRPIDDRVLIQLKDDHVVEDRDVHLDLPKVVEVLALAGGRKRNVSLAPVPVKVMERLEVALVHHGKVSPNLDHFSSLVDEELPLHLAFLLKQTSERGPEGLLFFQIRRGPKPHDDIGVQTVQQFFVVEKPLHGFQRRDRYGYS